MDRRKDRRKEKRYLNHLTGKLKFGMYVEDCRYHPCVITKREFSKSDLHGSGFQCESLVDGSPSASTYHCGPLPLSKAEAYERAEFMKSQGMEAYLRRYCGYTDEAIMYWRKLDAEWNFNKG